MSITTVDIAPLAQASDLPPVLLTVEEAARCLRIGRTTCYALIRTGELESLTIGGLRRVPADAPAAYLAQRRAEQRAA
ncbi:MULTISPECIES: helix-turn-helix domain-containing protein [Streptomyces]|uniref:helix-turn-helix domain-containing protein n=1 Tax=Streptomyces TaxID=1883 RepID=UPI00073C1672|nr:MULTISPECIES: helix-turn-helix domain-containing protein [unclassified Streptomyces]MEE1754174.1 helix-turn-helix domain-containing protein [Streptomyces sp. SP18CS02]ODA71363.1 Helix-turn-helix domain protein [Streptomyces sp. AVP053U2]